LEDYTELQKADANYVFFRSRRTIAILFGFFVVVGVVLIYFGGTVKIALGTSILAAACVSLATLLIDQIRNGEIVRMKQLIGTGFLAAYKKRNLDEYESSVRKANFIDVAGYTLSGFVTQNYEILQQRALNGSPVKVRVIAVNPQSQAAATMEEEEGFQSGHYASLQEGLRQRLREIEGIEIRVLDRHLSMMLYRIDDVLYTGPYPASSNSSTALTLKVGRGWVFDRQMADFDALWSKSTPLA